LPLPFTFPFISGYELLRNLGWNADFLSKSGIVRGGSHQLRLFRRLAGHYRIVPLVLPLEQQPSALET
jgi:hypothetical protein